MKSKIKKLRLVFAILLVIGIFVFINKRPSHKIEFDFEKSTIIENEIKLEAKPQYVLNNNLYIWLHIESYENRAILDYKLEDIALLVVDDETAIKPSNYKSMDHTQYSKEGILVFELETVSKNITLTIFDDSDYEFSWNLN